MKHRIKQRNGNDLYYFMFTTGIMQNKIIILYYSCCKHSLGEGKLQSLTTDKQRTAGSIELIGGNNEMERSTQNAV